MRSTLARGIQRSPTRQAVTGSVDMSKKRIVRGNQILQALAVCPRQLQRLVEKPDARRSRILILSVALAVFLAGLVIEVLDHQPIGVALFAVLILLNLTRLVLTFRPKPSGF
jgi:Flp pilus assembly protein TadB